MPSLAHLPGSAGLGSWSADPGVLIPLVMAAVLYRRGIKALWGGRARTARGRGVQPWRALCFAGGLAAIVLALMSPLDRLSDELLSAHMAQHLLLIVVAAPLIILGKPAMAMFLGLPLAWRRRLRHLASKPSLRSPLHVVTNPLVIWFVHVAVIWAWHVPSLYQEALADPAVHAVEHAAFLGTALLFWWAAFSADGGRRLARGADIIYVFTAGLQSGALGALFTFATVPLYPAYRASELAWNLMPLQDQQLAGLVMWIPAGVVYLVAAVCLFLAWLRSMDMGERRVSAPAQGAMVR